MPLPEEILPQIDLRPFREQCTTDNKQLKLTGVLQLWLSLHFYNRNNIKEPGIKERVWNPDPEKSKIQILPLEYYQPTTTEQRPSLIIKRQELKFIRFGIDNRLLGSGGPDVGRRFHVAGMQGSHTVFCVADVLS